MSLTEWISNLWNDYYALIILGAVILVIFGISQYKKRRGMKAPKPPKKMVSKPLPEINIPIKSTEEIKKHNIDKLYEELTTDKKKDGEDVISRLGDISNEMKQTSNKLDENIISEKIRLAKMVDKVSKDRVTLEKLTKEMIILSKKYEDKETILGVNLLGMKKLTDKEDVNKPSIPSDPLIEAFNQA